MLGDRHCRVRGLAAQQRRRVGGGNHDHRAGEPGRSKLVLDELAHLPAALADQREHRDVAGGLTGEHPEQRGLAHAGAREQAEPLALAAGGETINCPNAEVQPRPKPAARGGVRRSGADGAGRRAAPERCASVKRPAERVDHPAKPVIRDGEHPAAGGGAAALADGRIGQDDAARPQSVQRAERHCLGGARAEADDLRRHRQPTARQQGQPIADRAEAGETGDLDQQPREPGHLPFQPNGQQLPHRASGPPRSFRETRLPY